MLKSYMTLLILVILVLLIIIFGGIGVYLAEYKHHGANITKLDDAFWWAVVTITTVGYGDYYPVTAIGRIIAVFTMFSGIGIVVILVGMLSQQRLQRIESWLKPTSEVHPNLLVDEMKANIKNKIDGLEKLTEDDFNTFIIMVKSLRRTLLEESEIKCLRCSNLYQGKPKFCSNCGIHLN